MPYATSGSIELLSDTPGHASDQPLVLIVGLGRQTIGWDAAAVRDLADQGTS